MLPGIPLSPLIPAPHAHPQFPLCCAVVSHFSHAQLFETLWTVTLQAPLSMGFSRQGYWSGLPCPPPGDLADPGTEPWSLMSPLWQAGSLPPGSPMQGFVCVWCLVVSSSLRPHPPGSSILWILQAKLLEWVAMAFFRDLPNPGIDLRFPTLQADSLPSEPPRKPTV